MAALWLLEFDPADAAAVPAGHVWWRSVDGLHGRCYAAAPAGPRWQRLGLLQDLPGHAAGAAATHHYVVETDVAPGDEADFHAWYAQEHLPGLAAVPGTVRARRYRRADGHPRFGACYDLAAAGVLDSAPWLAVRHTAWSDRVRPRFVGTRRLMFERVAAGL